MEEMVENIQAEAAGDDVQLEAPVTEEHDASETLDSVMDEAPQQTESEPANPAEASGNSEPGWIKKRVGAAVDKAIRETEQRIRAEYDAKLAPLMERMMEQDAQELVRSGKVKDLETAKELVRYRQGQGQASTPAAKPEQPRNDNGQFARKNDDTAIQTRIDMLQHQADKIMGTRKIDVLAEFNSNQETKNKVISGEWDFYDVADYLTEKKAGRRAPSPMRSSNGASGAEKSTIASMTDEQFERLNKRLEEGARFKV